MRIDGQTIPQSEISDEFRRLAEQQGERPEGLGLTDEELRSRAEENVINKHLILREARRRFPTIKIEEVRRRARKLQEQYGRQFDPVRYQAAMEDDVRAEKLMQAISEQVPRVTDEQISAEYERDPSAWASPARVHVSHIVRHTFGGADPGRALQQIMQAQELLRAGQPFEAVARQFSDQFGQAGDLGTFARGAMVEKFENVVFRMKAGETSDVFQTQFGYHIALVHERFESKERSLDEARSEIRQQLQEAREREAFDAFVMDLRESARIEHDSAPDEEPGEPQDQTTESPEAPE
jgi:peptidyl-prolyl cis-trans isomerase C